MEDIKLDSVICKTCRMPASLDEDGNCEFHRIRKPGAVSRLEARHNESQILLTVLLLAGSCAVTVAVFGWTVFLVASNIMWLVNSGYWYRKARFHAAMAKLAVDNMTIIASPAPAKAQDEWADTTLIIRHRGEKDGKTLLRRTRPRAERCVHAGPGDVRGSDIFREKA